MREDYRSATLDAADLAPTWHEQLLAWIGAAREAGLPDPNAMVLGTGDDEGRLTTRTVLAKDVDERGVTFFTNYTSEKSHQLRQTRRASATFPWLPLPRPAGGGGPPGRPPRAGPPPARRAPPPGARRA